MKRNGMIRFLCVLFITLAFGFTWICSAEPNDTGVVPKGNPRLKKACIKAATCGIKLEIARYQGWIDLRKSKKVNDSDLPELERTLKILKADLEKYQHMKLEDYTVPNPIQAIARVREKPTENTVLYLDDMSRSGPWYQMTGIQGGRYSALKMNVRYDMVFYPVYPRSYFNMESWYVYIDMFQPVKS